MPVRMLTVLAIAALVAGCRRERPADRSSPASTPAAAARSGSASDPCSLLSVPVVEAAIGPLAWPPYRYDDGGAAPAATGDWCVYQAKDLRSVRISVEWSGGAASLKMMRFGKSLADSALHGKLVDAAGDTILGEWDEILATPMHCCELNALRGDQLVHFLWAGSRLTLPQAAALTDSAVKQFAHPLDYDATAATAAAISRLAAEPKHPDVCSLVTAAEAEAIMGKLAEPPKGDGNAMSGRCKYRGEGAGGLIVVHVYWRDGYARYAEETHSDAAFKATAVPRITGGAVKGDSSIAPAEAGPWEEQSMLLGIFRAVKKDVMMSSEDSFARTEQVKALLTKAMGRL